MLNDKINELTEVIIRRRMRLLAVFIFCVLSMVSLFSITRAQEEAYLTDEVIPLESGIDDEDLTDDESPSEEPADSEAEPEEAEPENDDVSAAEPVEPEEIPVAAEADSELEEDDEEDAEEIRRAAGAFAYGISVDVSSWTEFVAALQDEDVGEIVFTNNIERTSAETGNNETYNPGTITRSIRIDGGGYSLLHNNGTSSTAARTASTLFLGTPLDGSAVLEIENLTYEKTYGPAVAMITQSGTGVTGWTTRFINVSSTEANVAALLNAPNAADVEISGGMNISKTGTGSGQDIIAAKQITASGTVIMQEKGNDDGSIMSANGEIIVQAGATFIITPMGTGSGFIADKMTVGSGADISFYYERGASNTTVQSALYIDELVLEESAQIDLAVRGNICGLRTNSLVMKSGSLLNIDSANTTTGTGSGNGYSPASAIYMQSDGVLEMTSANLNISNTGTYTNEGAAVASYYQSANGIYGNLATVLIDNGSTVDIDVSGIGIRSAIDCDFRIINSSKVNIESDDLIGFGLNGNYDNNSGTIKSDLLISGAGSELNIESSSYVDDNDGTAMYIKGAGSTLKVTDYAKLNVRQDNGRTDRNSAMMIQGDDAIIEVHDKAEMRLTTAASSSWHNPVLRFRYVGGMTLDIDDADVYIESEGGNGTGIRMYGGGNAVQVRNGGYLYVHNVGNGTAANGNTTTANMAILYTGSTNNNTSNSFYLDGTNSEGVGSTVEIIADDGQAIHAAGSLPLAIEAGKDTIFEAYGRTNGNGVFDTANNNSPLQIIIDEPEYFDFKNGSMNNPCISSSGTGSTFDATNTTFSLWTTGTDWNQNPTMSLRRLTHMNLSGTNFRTIDSIDSRVDEAFKTSYTNITAYNRMSSNNARPIVDELRIGTDADQYIYGHVSIPEGRGDEDRDAWTDEVYVFVEVLDENNNVVYGPLKTQTVGLSEVEDTGINPFGMEESARGGMFEIAVPDGEYLQEGHTVRVIGAWRGDDADTMDEARQNDQNVISRDTDLKADPYTVQHVIPPTALTINSVDTNVLVEDDNKMVLTTRTKTISGTYPEAGVTIYAYHNGTLISDGTDVVGTDNKWQVTLDSSVDLNEGDIISIALNDKNPPGTLEDTDRAFLEKWTIKHQGNESPEQNIQFHNVEIAKRLDLEVVYFGTLELVAPTSLDFQSQTIVPVEREYKVTGISAEELGVLDTRKIKNEWKLYLTVNTPMTQTADNNLTLPDALIYKYKGNELQLVSGNAQLVYEGENEEDEDFHDIYSETWYGSSGDGLYLKVKPGVARTGEYEGQVTWILYDTP